MGEVHVAGVTCEASLGAQRREERRFWLLNALRPSKQGRLNDRGSASSLGP